MQVHLIKYLLPNATAKTSSAPEVLLLILPSFYYIIIANFIVPHLVSKSKTLSFVFEFFIIVVPTILDQTILSPHINSINFIAILLVCVLILYFYLYKPDSRKTLPEDAAERKYNLTRRSYITNIRSSINLLSVIAILAVDFQIFPSRFSKTAKTGYSLMDIGVGLFVFANGIVAPEVKGKKDPIKSSIKGSALLLIIGILRFALTKLTNYSVSEFEYGLHWNFFITLAITRIFSSCIFNIVPVKFIYLNATILICAHEVLLQIFLKQWIFSDQKRTNFIEANKEGIVSTLGYTCLYFYSVYFSYKLNCLEKLANHKKINLLFFASVTGTLFMTWFCTINVDISRRLANSAYIFWILFIGIFVMWLFYLYEYFMDAINPYYLLSPKIHDAINFNGLSFFLVGNVLTGLINLTISTNQVGPLKSLLIIIVYMFICCSLTVILYYLKIKIKL